MARALHGWLRARRPPPRRQWPQRGAILILISEGGLPISQLVTCDLSPHLLVTSSPSRPRLHPGAAQEGVGGQGGRRGRSERGHCLAHEKRLHRVYGRRSYPGLAQEGVGYEECRSSAARGRLWAESGLYINRGRGGGGGGGGARSSSSALSYSVERPDSNAV